MCILLELGLIGGSIIMPSNLRALADVMSELAVYSDRCISGELGRFLACPTASKFDVLYKKMEQYLDDVIGLGVSCW